MEDYWIDGSWIDDADVQFIPLNRLADSDTFSAWILLQTPKFESLRRKLRG